jgi:hypothetical protein
MMKTQKKDLTTGAYSVHWSYKRMSILGLIFELELS